MVLFFVSTFFVLYSAAQQPQDWVKFYDQLGDIDDVESSAWESTYDILCDLATHPIALNTATRQDLEQIPFLTDAQIEELCMYVYQYGGMKSWGELALIESLDEPRRRLLPYFLTLDSGKDKTFPSLRNIAKYGHSEVVTALRIPCYTRKGDRKGYLGYPYKHWLRYTFSYGQYVKAGLTASQDAGEPFFSGRNRYGYDYYSPYLMLRNMGRLKAFAVGRYRLRFGMGLVMNNDFGFGKAASIALLGRTSTSIRAHSSRSEANYMQGAAATIGLWKGLELTGFASLRKIDATLSRDSTSIVTLLHTGYHRTPSEMARKHNAEEQSIGGNIRYSGDGFHIGATGVFMQFSKPLTPKPSSFIVGMLLPDVIFGTQESIMATQVGVSTSTARLQRATVGHLPHSTASVINSPVRSRCLPFSGFMLIVMPRSMPKVSVTAAIFATKAAYI